jgi:hypothetical protein
MLASAPALHRRESVDQLPHSILNLNQVLQPMHCRKERVK